MPSFDYIESKDFRISLESDFNELMQCADAGAWKSVHVVAGSIIESLLVDYLQSTTHPTRPAKNPLTMDLADAVSTCRSEGVITNRTADLCSVVRSFRNLIHPGRMVRLGEEQPNEESSKVAIALVNIITGELEKVRRKSVGLTAEQVLSKIRRDSNAISIIKHLMGELSETQRERLLIDLIPTAYGTSLEDDFDDSSERLAACYRLILEAAHADTRKKAAAQFVELVRNGDGGIVMQHGCAFFMPTDLSFVAEPNRAMIKDHLFVRLPTVHTLESIRLIDGIGEHLDTRDVLRWLDPIIKSYTSTSVNQNVKQGLRNHMLLSLADTTPEVDKHIFRRFDDWIAHYRDKLDMPDKAESVRALKVDAEAQMPF